MRQSEGTRHNRHIPAIVALFVWLAFSASAIAATSQTVTKADGKRGAGQTTEPLVRDSDVSMFFPPKPREGNAASAYTRAFELFNMDRERTRYFEQWDLLLERPLIRKALDQITSGAQCQSCDFIPYLPDDLSRSSKFPYLVETTQLPKLLSKRFDREMADKQKKEALATARALMAFGRHLRGSALVFDQEIQGIAIEWLAVSCFRRAYGPSVDTVTSAKMTLMTRLLEASRDFIRDAKTSHAAAGGGFSADLGWLRSSYPVLRCEAIIHIAQQTFPDSVLIKPTPAIDIGALLEKLEQATTLTKARIRREEVETKIRWPRKGVGSNVTAEDVQRLREVLEPAAQSDPDWRVRVLAKRFLDSLVEPKPTPRAAGRPTSPTLQLTPRPRPLRPFGSPSSPTLQIPPPPRPPRPSGSASSPTIQFFSPPPRPRNLPPVK